MKISMIGTGYVGLVTGSCIASKDVKVRFMDINQKKIADLEKGIIPIYEPGLDEIVLSNIKNGYCDFTTKMRDAYENDIIFLAVGTPQDVDGSADLEQVLSVAHDIGVYSEAENLTVIVKSTVPPGTCELVKEEILQQFKYRKREGFHLNVVSNPEFLKEGSAIKDFKYPDRIVVGVDNDNAEKVMREIYKDFDKILVMDVKSSELTKYASNAMLATRISFMNELANLCDVVGGNIELIKKGMGMDKRIGSHFLNAGTGYGGSCFPKDVKALINLGENNDSRLTILESVDESNDEQKLILVEKLTQNYYVKPMNIAIWGLSFKANTDDMREASSIKIIKDLLNLGATVRVYDPVANENAKEFLPPSDNLIYEEHKYNALIDADCLFLVTEWDEFKYNNLDFDYMKCIMRKFKIYDGRNLYNKNNILNQGFSYEGIGNNNI